MKTLEVSAPIEPIDSLRGGVLGYAVIEYTLDREREFIGLKSPALWGYRKPVISEITIGGQRIPRRVYNCGDYRLTCPQVDVTRKTDERAVIRALHFPQNAFHEALGEAAEDFETQFERLQRYAFRSDLLDGVVDRLQLTATQQRPGDKLYTDSLINTAVMELWRLSGGAFDMLSPGENKLSSAALRKIDRYIDDHSVAKIDVAALAQVVDMPTAMFQTAFRETTGRTPYQHILGRRVANARCMIEASSFSLAEIAFRTGFSSQSHMTDVFKAKLGVTPGGLRRMVN